LLSDFVYACLSARREKKVMQMTRTLMPPNMLLAKYFAGFIFIFFNLCYIIYHIYLLVKRTAELLIYHLFITYLLDIFIYFPYIDKRNIKIHGLFDLWLCAIF